MFVIMCDMYTWTHRYNMTSGYEDKRINTQNYRITELQNYRITELQNYKDTSLLVDIMICLLCDMMML